MASTSAANHYRTLGISRGATEKQIREAYKSEALKWHPDKRTDIDSTEIFKRISEAYKILSNADLRAEYEENAEDGAPLDDVAAYLNIGATLSDQFKKQLREWEAAGRDLEFCNNIDDTTAELLKQLESVPKSKSSKSTTFCCPICQLTSSTKESHHAAYMAPYLNWIHTGKLLSLEAEFAAVFSIAKELPEDDIIYVLIEAINGMLPTAYAQAKQLALAITEEVVPIPNTRIDWLKVPLLKECIIEPIKANHLDQLVHVRYFRTEPRLFQSEKSRLKLDLAARVQSGTIKLDFPANYVSDSPLMIIHDPPDSSEGNTCVSCCCKIGMFSRKPSCRGCGQTTCKVCVQQMKLPHLGYNFYVDICLGCITSSLKLYANQWIDFAKATIKTDYNDAIRMIRIGAAYIKQDGLNAAAKLEAEGDVYWAAGDIILASAFYFAVHIPLDTWITKIVELIRLQDYQYVSTLLHNIQVAYNPDQYWLDLARQYELQPTVAAYFYHQANPTEAELLAKIIDVHAKQNHSLVKILAKYLAERTAKPDAIAKLFQSHAMYDLAFYFYQVCRIDWEQLLPDLLVQGDISAAIAFYKQLDDPPDMAVLNGTIDHAEVFDDAYRSIGDESSLWYLTLLIYSAAPFAAMTEACIAAGAYDKAIICCRLNREQPTRTWMELGKHFLEIDQPTEAFKCFTLEDPDWDALGKQFFTEKRYTSAVKCFARGTDPAFIFEKAIELLRMGNKPKAMLYFYQLIQDNHLVLDVMHQLVSMELPGLTNCLLAVLAKQHLLSATELMPLHRYLSRSIMSEPADLLSQDPRHLAEPSMDIAKLVGVLHIMNEKVNWIDLYYRLLRDTVYAQDATRTAHLVSDLTGKLEIAQRLYQEQTDKRDVSSLPVSYRSIIYILSAAIHIHEENYMLAAKELTDALVCYPVSDTGEAVAILLQSDGMQVCIYKHYVSGLRDIITGSDINVPEEDMLQGVFKSSKTLTMIKKFERGISKNATSSVEAGLLYLDLSMAVNDAAGLAGCFIMSALHFSAAIESSSDKAETYAYRNAVTDICETAYTISHRHLTPTMQIHFNKLILAVLLEANRWVAFYANTRSKIPLTPVINPRLSSMLQTVTTNLVHLGRVTPLVNLPTSLVCDIVYIDLASRNYSEPLWTHSTGTTLCPVYLSDYYLLEAQWKGWFGTDQFDRMREISMLSLLRAKNWSYQHVEAITDWKLFPRTADGWVDPKKSTMNFCIDSYKAVRGVRICKSTGTVQLLLEPAGSAANGLFTTDDVNVVFTLDVPNSMFTLDPPDTTLGYHPYQEMRYHPKTLSGTDYLATLLQTDYLLKMFTTGVEVSSKAPFNLRDSSSMLQRLPARLRHVLKPIHAYDNRMSSGNTHRFWIEAGDLYHSYKEEEDYITCQISDIDMQVKKHLLRVDANGKLVDDIDTDDTSAEAIFAQTFTAHYDEIGAYFPEFLRLKELMKLGSILTILRSLKAGLEKTIRKMRVDVTEISTELSYLKNQIESYPKYSDYNVDVIYAKCLAKQGITTVPDYQQRELKNQIKNNLQAEDNNILSQMLAIISNNYHIHQDYIRSDVCHWLTYSASNSFINTIGQSQLAHKKAELQLMVNGIADWNIDTDHDPTVSLGNGGECPWVPAAFASAASTKVYGGVVLGSNIKGSTTNIYSATVLNRMASVSAADKGHRFPMGHDSHIIANGTVTTPKSGDGRPYQVYSLPGSLNNSTGVYTVGVRPHQTAAGNTINVITHRCFYSR